MIRLTAAFLAVILASASAQQFYGFTTPNIKQYARIDLDVRDMEMAADKSQWARVNRIYRMGIYGKPRTLQALSLQAPRLMANEPLYKRYRAYWKNGLYADKVILDAIIPRAPVRGKPGVFRAEVAAKGAQYFAVWMWVIHKMEQSVRACASKRAPVARQQLDQAVADYRGSVVMNSLTASGYLLHTLAEKRCSNFRTCVRGKRGPAKINIAIYAQFRNMKNFVGSGQCARARTTKNQIVRLMHVPLVQGCLRYMVKVEQARAAKVAKDLQKAHAEGWAFCGAVLPSISRCNAGVAKQILNNFTPGTNRPMSTSSEMLSKRLQSVYGCLGINCGQVGNLFESNKKLLSCA